MQKCRIYKWGESMTEVNWRHEISDNDWERIKKFFAERTRHTMGRPCKDNRLMLNGILWILGTGAPWRDLPERYGPWQTVYKRFAKWQNSDLFGNIFAELAADADTQDFSIDGTYIKAHKASAGAKRGGRSYPKGGKC